MTNRHYILENGKVKPVGLMTWAHWFERNDTEIFIKASNFWGVRVSTVFLGIDHRFMGEGQPLIFESMIFGGLLDQEMDRYSTLEEARDGHKRMVLKAWLGPIIAIYRKIARR